MNNHLLKTSFMQSPLVTWVRTLLEDNCQDHSELFNGSFLNKAWLQIDPHPPYQCNNSITSEAASLSRIKNLNILLNNIRAFYENVLDQILVIKLPDVINIALICSDDLLMSVSPDSSFYSLINSYSTNACSDDMRTFLLLILGCAVQCEQKEVFIEKIKQLDISVQHSIVECIQQITDNPESVFMVSEWSDPPLDELEKDRLYSIFVSHISNLTKERDQLYQRVVRLSHELFNLTLNAANFSHTNSSSLKNLSLSNSSLNNNINHCDQKSHYLVELADVKSKLRRLQQELEEKSEIVVELKEIIEQNKEFCNKLRHDNLELTQEARTAKAYRDEIDILNERVRKIDRLEGEVQRYRDKMNELEFYKSRVEELREDNRILGETKTMLEEQLDSSRKRAEKLPELEEKILKLNAFGNELNLQRELDRNQIERLVEEVAHLRQEKKFANDELSKAQLELTDLRAQMRLNNETMLMKNDVEEGNLFDQINQDTSKRLIKLEHENQKLQNLFEDYKNNYVDIDSLLSLFPSIDYYSMHSEEDVNSSKDNENSSDNGGSEIHSTDSGYNSNKSKIEKLNDIKDYIEKQKVNQNSIKNLENVKFELEKEIGEFKKRLHDEYNKYETMERNYSQSCAENQKYQRIIEQKNKKIEEYSSELSVIESENQKLIANVDSLKLSLRKLNDLEIEMTSLEGDKHRLEQENKSFEKEINRLKSSIEFKDNIIDENSEKLSSFELENKRLKKEIESNNQITLKLKEVEKGNKDLANSVIVQKNTLSALQQDLVNEKLRAQKYADEFEKIVETINKLCLDNCLDEVIINIQKDISNSNDNLSAVISSCFRGVVDNCLSQKNGQIIELESQLNHLKVNNDEMQTVINSLKKQLNIGTESSDKNSLNSLSELQRSIDYLEEENKCLKSKLSVQTEANSELKIKHELIESKLAFINDRNFELQNEIAKLEVENSLLKSQNCSLENQTTQLQEQMVLIQDSIEGLKVKCEEYESVHKLLIDDNESLQEIHQQLTADYDHLTKNHGILKQLNKSLKSENKSLEEELKSHLQKHEEIVNKTNEELKSLRDRKEREEVEDINLKEKLSALASEHKGVTEEHKRLQTEHKMLQNIYKKLRSDNNELKLKHTELQGETAECKDRMNALNVEVSKLSNYCEMVALTNNTLEAQRKKLATQSTSLLSQYNDLLLDLSSSGCEKSVIDKLRDLCIKKDRLEKMFKEYDISIEKNMPRVSSKSQMFKLPEGQAGLDDTIYGRLWEAETPPIHSLDSITNSAALLRQYSLNSNLLTDKDKKFNDFSWSSPPRIPPRHGLPRQPVSSLSHHISAESNCKLPSQISYSPTDVNKMSINVSTRTTTNQISKPQDVHAIESNISKLQLLSTANSPLISKATSTGSSPAAGNNSGGYFMRGAFKSNSVNYGNYMRRPVDPKLNAHSNSASKHDHFSPQFLNAAANRKYGTLSSNMGSVSHRSNYQHHPASPSYHSDSSSSSHTPLDDSEKESEHVVYISNNNNNGNVCTTNNNVSTRSRITISNNCITVANDSIKSINGPTGTPSNKDNISIQISNVMNNNLTKTTEMATVNCTNAIGNDNSGSNANSNSIWYEYGCV